MAITLNKFASQCEKAAIRDGKITKLSSPRISYYQLSVLWRRLGKATKFRSDHTRWSEQEYMTAELIVGALVYLKRLGCENIESLLKDKIKEQTQRD